jgi:hypothetical protein
MGEWAYQRIGVLEFVVRVFLYSDFWLLTTDTDTDTDTDQFLRYVKKRT